MRWLGVLWVLSLVACAPQGLGPADRVPDFALRDENPSSATAGQDVGPLTFEGKVTGWYFGHSS